MKLRRIKKAQEPQHIVRKRKKNAKKVLRLVKLVLIMVLLAAAAVYAASSPFFNIADIDAGRTAHYDNRKLISLSGIQTGMNGFRLLFSDPREIYLLRDRHAEEAILEGCPYAKSAVVQFCIPDTFKIKVTERKPSMILETGEKKLLVDNEEYLLEVGTDIKKQGLPVIKGMKLAKYKPGKKLALPQDALSVAKQLYKTIRDTDAREEDKLLPTVDYVDVSDLYNVKFSVQSLILVNLGNLDDLNYKLNAVKTVLNKNIKKGERGKLDFSLDKNPVFTPENGG